MTKNERGFNVSLYILHALSSIIWAMPELLRFETVIRDDGHEMPVLVDLDSVSTDKLPETLSVDGEACDIDEVIVRRFVSVVERMQKEELPEGHFRDCVSFVMAMSGLWMPTHKPFERRYDCVMQHNDAIGRDFVIGPVSTGVPYNERFLGFEGCKFVYGHAAYVVETSSGLFALHKLGVSSVYALSTIEGLLTVYDDEVVHSIDSFRVVHMGEETFIWKREAAN